MAKENDCGSFHVHGSWYDVSIKILVCQKLLVRLSPGLPAAGAVPTPLQALAWKLIPFIACWTGEGC